MAKKKGGIEGIDRVMSGLRGKLVELNVQGTEGLRTAAGFIRRDMEKTPPKIPIDTGNLRGSWFIETIKGNRPTVIFGFNANYAVFVHEMVGADFTSPRIRYGPGKGKKRKYKPRSGAGPKFLEAALKRNVFKIIQIIRGRMTISGGKAR